MTFDHLANLMLNWGYEINTKHYFQFRYYLEEMLKKNRVMILRNEETGLIEAIILYYITNDYEKLYKKPMWKVAKDDENGTQIYIDKMVCRKYTKDVRHNLGRAIQERFPNVKELIYHRAPKDRCVRILREGKYEQVPCC